MSRAGVLRGLELITAGVYNSTCKRVAFARGYCTSTPLGVSIASEMTVL